MQLPKHTQIHTSIHKFIQEMRWRPAVKADGGTTWLELLILFERLGYRREGDEYVKGNQALKKENDKRREEKRAKTERILKQKLAATERRSRWRNVELYAEATKWITREDLEKRIEKALNRPERMY